MRWANFTKKNKPQSNQMIGFDWVELIFLLVYFPSVDSVDYVCMPAYLKSYFRIKCGTMNRLIQEIYWAWTLNLQFSVYVGYFWKSTGLQTCNKSQTFLTYLRKMGWFNHSTSVQSPLRIKAVIFHTPVECSNCTLGD